MPQKVWRHRQIFDAGKASRAFDPFPSIARAHREHAITTEHFFSSQGLYLLPCPAREPHHARLSTFAGDARDAVYQIAPAQAHKLGDADASVVEETNQRMIARIILDRLREREDLALGENAFREFSLDLRTADCRADFERHVAQTRGKGEQRFKRFESAGSRGRCALQYVSIFLEVRQIGCAQRFAGEGAKRGDVVPVGADRMPAFAV